MQVTDLGPGFKYHVVTICAVFFALTVGLVVGSLTFSPYVARSYSSTLRGLKSRLDQDLNDKTVEVDHLKRALSAALPVIIKDKLAGRTVAIVQTGDYPEEVNGIRDTLKLAGAQVVSIITVERAAARPEADVDRILAPLSADDPRLPTDREGFVAAIASTIAKGDTPNGGILSALERGDLLTLESGTDAQTPAGAVVLLAGSREDVGRPAIVDQLLVSALQKQGVMVVMCEPERAAVSDVPSYRSLGIDVATVDDIDSDIGRIALIYALRGAKEDYGVKPGAQNNLLPPLPPIEP